MENSRDMVRAVRMPSRTSRPRATVTTTALQSHALLNNEFMQKPAGYFAERVLSDPANP